MEARDARLQATTRDVQIGGAPAGRDASPPPGRDRAPLPRPTLSRSLGYPIVAAPRSPAPLMVPRPHKARISRFDPS